MAITHIQSAPATENVASATYNVILGTAQVLGDLIVVKITTYLDSTTTISTVTDTKGNTYHVGNAFTRDGTNAVAQAIYYAYNVLAAAASANTVKVVFSAQPTAGTVQIDTYRGTDTGGALDGTPVNGTGSGTSPASGNLTTTNANDLVFGGAAAPAGSGITASGAGWTSRGITGGNAALNEDQIVTSTGTFNATATCSSGAWVAQIIAFKIAGGTNIFPTAKGTVAVTALVASKLTTRPQPKGTVGVTAQVTPKVSLRAPPQIRGTTAVTAQVTPRPILRETVSGTVGVTALVAPRLSPVRPPVAATALVSAAVTARYVCKPTVAGTAQLTVIVSPRLVLRSPVAATSRITGAVIARLVTRPIVASSTGIAALVAPKLVLRSPATATTQISGLVSPRLVSRSQVSATSIIGVLVTARLIGPIHPTAIGSVLISAQVTPRLVKRPSISSVVGIGVLVIPRLVCRPVVRAGVSVAAQVNPEVQIITYGGPEFRMSVRGHKWRFPNT